jgi:hypothetical protein
MDDITEAVLNRDEVARFLAGSHGMSGDAARARILEYLEELRTTQRYELYRALEYPLYPILRKIERVAEHAERAVEATSAGRVVWASNHRSHTDYLVEPLVLDDAGVRPPIIAAGINLFGGPLGLIHKHVTGALPIRRNTKDPAYLITLKAYVGTLLHKHDLFFYPEGGRSYSGELKSPKTGLFSAALSANVPGLVIVPVAVAYDLVLEDHILARQGVKRAQRAFSRELAEMVRSAGRSAGSTRCCRRRCSQPRCGRRSAAWSCAIAWPRSSTRCGPAGPTSRFATPTRRSPRRPSRSPPAASSPSKTASTGYGSATFYGITAEASSTC